MKPCLTALLTLLSFTLSAADLSHERLIDSSWNCAVDSNPLGTLTFRSNGVLELSWSQDVTWSEIDNGVEIFGVNLQYADKTFTGINSAGKPIFLTLAENPVMPAKSGNDAGATDLRPIEEITTLKLLRDSDHRFSIEGQKVAFGRTREVKWETSWGSYDEEYIRNATYLFEVSHFGSEGKGLFEVLFLGKNIDSGERYAYSFQSMPISVTGDLETKIDVFHKATDTLYNALKIQIKSGSKPDSWIAWVRDGEKVMALSAGRGSLVDEYEGNLGALLAEAKAIVE